MKKSNETLWAFVTLAVGSVLLFCGTYAIGYKFGEKLGEIIFSTAAED